VTLIEALKRITAAAEDHPPLREAIVALVDTTAERVMDKVKDETPPGGVRRGGYDAGSRGCGASERRYR
jgi:hypothetical protein